MRHISESVAAALAPSFRAIYVEPVSQAEASASALATFCERHPNTIGALREYVRASAISDELSIRMVRAAKLLAPPRKQRIW